MLNLGDSPNFVQSCDNSDGKTELWAIAALEQFITSTHNEFDSWNAAYSLGKVFDPGNQIAIAALIQIIESTTNESTRRKAAYSLGKIDSGNAIAPGVGAAIAISTLEKIAASANDTSQRRQAAENLVALRGIPQSKQSPLSPAFSPSPAFLSSLLRGIASAGNDDTQRRRAL